jgi:hypothetical protein
MSPDERKVFDALDDPHWDARTIKGIARSTGLSQEDVLSILNKNAGLVEAHSSKNFGLIFQLRERTNPTDADFMDKALDYLSLGKRRRIA